jgi:hypothetical protein
MKRIILLFWVLIILPGLITHAQDAPVTTAGNVLALGDTVTVPVMVSGFDSIGSFGLQLLYDPGIATAVAVVTGSLLGGNINSTLDIPGKISLGWYQYPGVSLPDSSVIISIKFTKNNTGISPLEWFDDGYSCYYSNNDYVILNDLPTSSFYINGSLAFTTEAPVTTAPSVKSGPGAMIDIPVSVSGFSGIGKVRLTLDYDSSVFEFQSWTNTSGIPGLSITATGPGTIRMEVWQDSSGSGMSLPDGSILVTLHGYFSGGSSGLSWRNDSCSYLGPPPSYPPLIDFPKNLYYVNGSITQDLGIENLQGKDRNLNVYPNPVDVHGRIGWFMPSEGTVSFRIYTIEGTLVHSSPVQNFSAGDHVMDLEVNGLCNGMYLLMILIETNNQVICQEDKMIVR